MMDRSKVIPSLLALVLLLPWQCIDPLDTQPEEEKIILVMEGNISTKPGPHKIQLSKSARYGSRAFGEIQPVRNATVYIRSDDGVQVFLNEGIYGSYLTPEGFQAKVGNKYTLMILTESGERYASLPAEVVSGPEIKEIIPKFKVQPGLNNEAPAVGMELYARFDDPPDERNFYLWDTKGEYVLSTRPDLHSVPDGMGGEVIAPLDCCAVCYVNEGGLANNLTIFTDLYTDGQPHEKFVSFVKDDGWRFLETYMAVVEQYSLTKDAYAFYEILQSQLAINGNIFDPPPATLRGNIINLDDPDEETIGYFFATSMTSDTIFIPRSALTDPAPAVNIRDDCRGIRNASNVKPPYWP